MSDRPFASSALRTELTKFLQDRCQMQVAELSPELGFTFDAVFTGRDPLNVVVVEAKQTTYPNALKAVARKVQSFAWSLSAQKKHNLVTLILVLPDVPSPERVRRDLGELNGSARVFVLPETAGIAEIEAQLNSLAAPVFALAGKQAVGFAQLTKLLEGIDAEAILRMVESSGSEDELKSKLIERLESLSSEVESAIKKP